MRTWTPSKLAKLSICDCGFSLLREDIPLGADYEIDLSDQQLMIFHCGGCEKETRITWVWTKANQRSKAGYLPIIAFTFDKTQDKSYVQADNCPVCGHAMDCATHPIDDSLRPVEGDLSFCIYCASVLAFGPGMKLRKATPEEAKEAESQINELRNVLTQVKGIAS